MDDVIRVLHVDDDPEVADLTATFLERAVDGMRVETATSAEDGLARITGDRFDCIVSDYEMPGTDGIEFLEALREDHPDLPFILFTGKGSEAVASDAISAGVTDYLQKETGTEQYAVLANRIENVVASHRAHRRADRQERINALLRDLNRRLVEADTVEAVERTVCEALTDSDSYRFAWIGAPDPDSGEVVPRMSAGEAWAYLDDVTVRYDRTPEGEGPAGRTVRTREPHLVENIPEDAAFEPWRETAETHGYESVFVLPLVHGDTLHGVLAVYADHPHAFSEAEQDVLSELATTVGETIGSLKTRRRLVDRAAELRRKSRAVDAAPIGITISDPAQPDNPLIYVNERFETMTGYDREAAVGRNCRFLQGPGTREEPVAAMRRAIDEGEPVTVELRNYREDGTEFWNRVTVAPITDDAGEIQHWVGFQEDISERKVREQERAFFEQAVEQIGVGMAAYDERGEIQYVNEQYARLLGIERAALPGRPIWTVNPQLDEAQFEDYWDSYDLGETRVHDTIHERADTGERVPVSTITTHVRIDGTDYHIGTIRDVSEQKARERQLEREIERLDEFASIVSHDLRNPLNVATGRLELARAECDSDHLSAVARALARMDALIEDTLALAREGRVVDEAEPVDLGTVAADGWRHVDGGDADLVVADDLAVRADAERLRRLLENLFRNSVEHGSTSSRTESDDAAEHGSTSHRSQARDDTVEHGSDGVTVRVGALGDEGFYVEDDGGGIPADERDEVFEPGYSTADDGTGFGLAIVQEIAEAHGWTVSVTENAAGGTRFEFVGVETGSSG